MFCTQFVLSVSVGIYTETTVYACKKDVVQTVQMGRVRSVEESIVFHSIEQIIVQACASLK